MRSIALFLFVSLAVLAGCGSDSGSSAGAFEGQWQLDSGTLDGIQFPLVEGYRVTFQLDDDQAFSGTAACNGYGGTGSLEGDTLTIDEWFITEMGCEPAVMASEQAFVTVLQRQLQLAKVDDQLMMTADGVDLTFSLVPEIPTSDLVGTTWQLHTLFDGEAASSIRGDATLRFDADGSFEGSTGCRSVVGTYVLNGDEIGITQMSATGECPADMTRQDGFVIGVLESPRVEVEADQLRLWTAGDTGLGYNAAG